jgi:hypothetical protein
VSHSRILEFTCIFAEGLLALLADEDHVKRLHERMVALFLVTFRAVEPFLAYPFSASIAYISAGATYSMASGWRLGR